jgi:CheY-like chemotaxis protein
VSASKPRILIVEDELRWRMKLREILQETGEYDVVVVESYEAGVAALEASGYDLALVDIRLMEWDAGNMQGLDILEKLKELPKTAAIVVTGYATPEILKECYEEHEVSTVLLKQRATPAEYRDAVRRALRASAAGSRRSGRKVGGEESPEKSTLAEDRSKAGAGKPVGSCLVLIVDDNESWRQRLALLVEEMGYEAVVEADYVPALGRLRRQEFALAIVDLRLDRFDGSNFDGLNILLECRECGIPTVVVSGFMTHELAQRVYREYAVHTGFQKKQLEPGPFRAAVQEAIDGCVTKLASRQAAPEVLVQIRQSQRAQFLESFAALRGTVLHEYRRARDEIDEAARARFRLGGRVHHRESDERWWRENVIRLDADINEIWDLMRRLGDLSELRQAEEEIRERCKRWPVWWQES